MAAGEWEARSAAAIEGHPAALARSPSATYAADPAERFAFGLRPIVGGIRWQLP